MTWRCSATIRRWVCRESGQSGTGGRTWMVLSKITIAIDGCVCIFTAPLML